MEASSDKRATALAFLQAVLPAEGAYFVAHKRRGSVHRKAVDNFEQIIDAILFYPNDAWFSTASFIDKTKSSSDNIKFLRAFRMDVDCGYQKPYDTQVEGVGATVRFAQAAGLPLPGIVSSGNGLHLWWPLAEPIIKPVWERYAKALKELTIKHEFKADPATIADSARILRLPGTLNYKDYEHPKEVKAEDKFFERGPYGLDEFYHLLPNGEDKQEKFDCAGTVLDHANYAHYSSMLDALSPSDDRAVWFKVGCAIKRLNWGDEGYKLWMKWSSKSPKFNEADQLKTWNSISDDYDGEHITPASLIYLSTLSTGTDNEHKQNLDGEDQDWHNDAPSWQKTASGHMKENSYINAKLAIEKLEIACRFNEMTKVIEARMEPKDSAWVEVDDAAYRYVRALVIRALHSDPGLTHVRNAMWELGYPNKYNPIIEYIDTNRWDGVERVKTWLIDCLGAEDTEANRFFGELILIAAIRRLRKPGTAFDHMLILEGSHGIGKSTVVKILALCGILGNGYYQHTTFNRDIHRFIESIKEAWFVEWNELAGIKTGMYWESIKACISETIDTARMAYDAGLTRHYRRCIFIGTTNETTYLPPIEGNRRFWPIRLKDRIDLQKLRSVVPQLYAEANLKEKGYFDINLIPYKFEEEINKLQLLRTIPPASLDYLDDIPGRKDVPEGKEFVSNKAVKLHLGLTARDVLSKSFNIHEIKYAMKALGWEESSKTIDGKTQRGYERSKC